MTAIEWTDATHNPVRGCTRISEGCRGCYIERSMPFRTAGIRFTGPAGRDDDQIGATTGIQLFPERLNTPRGWPRTPKRVFTCSLGDWFHREVSELFLAQWWATMEATPHITWQVLTKRPARALALLTRPDLLRDAYLDAQSLADEQLPRPPRFDVWPLPNVWIGTSVENQSWADNRIPTLLEIPAARRFVSAEPLIGPVELDDTWLSGPDRIDWLIVGGESGPTARPMHPNWARSLRTQCAAAGTPFFFKQWGGWAPARPDGWYSRTILLRRDGSSYSPVRQRESADDAYLYAPRSKGLRELDGRTWSEFPPAAVPA